MKYQTIQDIEAAIARCAIKTGSRPDTVDIIVKIIKEHPDGIDHNDIANRFQAVMRSQFQIEIEADAARKYVSEKLPTARKSHGIVYDKVSRLYH